MRTVIFFLFAIMAALAYRLYIAPDARTAPIVVDVTPPTSGIHLLSATYGPNCGAGSGNATKAVGGACDGKDNCSYKVEVSKLGDPASGCAKSFVASYECLPDGSRHTREIPAEAGLGSEALFSCGEPAAQIGSVVATPAGAPASGLYITSATYGLNCGGVAGNATRDLGNTCNGKDSCDYEIHVAKFGDPQQGCAKEFVAHYECAPSQRGLVITIPGESGLGSHISFSCAASAGAAALPQGVLAEIPPAGIYITSATYGPNCGGTPGNATNRLANSCNGRESCDYQVDVANFGDPKRGCAKAFTAEYVCAPGSVRFTRKIPGEAGMGSHLAIDCAASAPSAGSPTFAASIDPPSTGIYIKTATYGQNCGAKPGNATIDLSNSCNGKDSCDYQVDVAKFGDPKKGCGKDFTAFYRCTPGRTIIAKKLPGESGLGSHVLLDCPTARAVSPER
jgi:hypothetical protein